MSELTKEVWFFLLRLRDSGAYNMIDFAVARQLSLKFGISAKRAEKMHLDYCVRYYELKETFGLIEPSSDTSSIEVLHKAAHAIAHKAALDAAYTPV